MPQFTDVGEHRARQKEADELIRPGTWRRSPWACANAQRAGGIAGMDDSWRLGGDGARLLLKMNIQAEIYAVSTVRKRSDCASGDRSQRSSQLGGST